MRALILRLRALLLGRRAEQDLDDELSFHLEMSQRKYAASGVTDVEATRRARARFGSVAFVKDCCRDLRGVGAVDTAAREVRLAVRGFRQSPIVAATIIGTLALAIGANAAVLAAVDAVLFRPLGYRDAERIVVLRDAHPQAFVRFAYDLVLISPDELRETNVFESISHSESGGLNFGMESPERVAAAIVEAGFFEVLGVGPIVGRALGPEDLRQPVAVIGSRLWKARFDADPAVLGRSIVLNERTFTVVGVMPPGFEYPDKADVWVPEGPSDAVRPGTLPTPVVIARLAPGVSIAQAKAEVIRLRPRANPETTNVTPLRSLLVGDRRTVLVLISLASLLVLALGSATAVQMLLARAAVRGREFSLRRALGATRMHLARQITIEGLTLLAGATVVVIPMAWWTLSGLRALAPQTLGDLDVSLDARAGALLSAVVLVVCVCFILVPLVAFRSGTGPSVSSGHGVTIAFRRRTHGSIVVAEIAVAVVFMACALAVLRTVGDLMNIDLGPRHDDSIVMDLTVPHQDREMPNRIQAIVRQLDAAASSVPGIVEAGLSEELPGRGELFAPSRSIQVAVEGGPEDVVVVPPPRGGVFMPPQVKMAATICVTPGYFAALGVDILAGRPFADADAVGAPPVAVVSEHFARTVGLESPAIVGRRLNAGGTVGRNPVWAEIVGVARDVRLRGPNDESIEIAYVPCAQRMTGGRQMHMVARGAAPLKDVLPRLQAAVASVDPRIPLYNVAMFRDVRAAHAERPRFTMTTMLAFGGLALMLSAIGLCGVIGYLVQIRTREIGIRMAVGAPASRVRRDVMRDGLVLAIIGIVAGVLVTLGLSRIVWSQIPGAGPLDLMTMALLSAGMLIVTALATWVPAQRATRIDPLTALRAE